MVAPVGQQRIKNGLQVVPVLVGLAVRKIQLQNAPEMGQKRSTQPGSIDRMHGRVRDDQCAGGSGQFTPGLWLIQQAAANHDGVAALGQSDVDDGFRCMRYRHTPECRGYELGAGTAPESATAEGETPASSSCMMIMFTRVATEGRPVSITKCAVSR